MAPRPEPSPAAGARRAAWSAAALSPARNETLGELRRAPSQPFSIAVFSSTTWRPIAPLLEGELLIEGIQPSFTFFEHGAIDAGVAAARPGGGDSRFDLAVLAIDDRASWSPLHDPAVPFGAGDAEEVRARFFARVDRLSALAARTVVFLPPAPARLPRDLERTPDGDLLPARVMAFSAGLARELGRAEVEALDLDRAIGALGAGALDDRLWHLGRIRYSEAGFLALARAISSRVLLQAGKGIKAVVVDLDGTLWGGIAGEDGVGGVLLGGEYPGSAYREFQEELKRWKRAGILLAVASKNNPEDALAVIDGHPEMVLRSADFDHLEIHWEPKAVSIARILDTFRIGPDAILFVDDRRVEREAVSTAFPTLRILELPEEPLDFCACLREAPWPLFTSLPGGGPDRSDLQAQQRERQAAAGAAASPEEYLRSLGMEVEVTRDRHADIPRIAQLHAKTNQFNLAPSRLTEAQIEEAMEDPIRMVLGLRYSDRFGDAGLVGAAVARSEGGTLAVETFLLSCRVIGLGVELALLQALIDEAGDDAGAVLLPYRPTEKNAPARKFLESLGGPPAGARGLLVPRNRIPRFPDWIAVRPPSVPCAMEVVHAS